MSKRFLAMHLTHEQRYQLSFGIQEGWSIRRIACFLGRAPSVISREIRRNGRCGEYDPDHAHRLTQDRRAAKRAVWRLTGALKQQIDELLAEYYSPEQIRGRLLLEGLDCVSVPTIYKYIWQNKADRNVPSEEKLYHYLRLGRQHHNRRRAKREGMGVIPDRVMIDQRPEQANLRQRFGDFEADTMWIAGKAAIVTVVERKSRLSFIRAVPCRKAEVVEQALCEILAPWKGVAKTLTVDNGKEFYRHKKLAEKLGIDIYFAHPYRSGERGTNENTNGLYRQFIPRSTTFEAISRKQMMLMENKLNNRPRKIFGFKTPMEIFDTYKNLASVAFTT